ncbi:MAG: hypothetical protein RMK84_19895, partial [Oscillochloridaceae bacterium]|nr:hypothetical protein [Oscillochloridaceae bacterium]
MRIRTWTIALIFTLSVLLGGVRVTAQPPQPGEAPAPTATPVETLLNPDGTLRLDGSFSGALDASGWQVILDPEQGPIFQPQAGTPQWTNLGSAPDGALSVSGFSIVNALAVSGSDVYVGGWFQNAAGIPEADYVARWNGSAWSALGGSGGNSAITGQVFALAASGGNLYVGGSFTNAAGIPQADYVARWDGTNWNALGGGADGALNGPVLALAVSGANVYAGGTFTDAAGNPTADYVARWNGMWWNLGGTFDGALSGPVNALAVSGSNVYAGGNFTDAAGIPQADYVARWDGTNWNALGGGA